MVDRPHSSKEEVIRRAILVYLWARKRSCSARDHIAAFDFRTWRRIRPLFRPPELMADGRIVDKTLRDANSWAARYRPISGRPYALVLRHAEKRLDLTMKNLDSLTSKAGSVVTLGVGASGTIATALWRNWGPSNWITILAAICFLLAAICAFIARSAHAVSVPMNVRKLIEAIDSKKTDEQATVAMLATNLHVAIVGAQQIMKWQERHLSAAHLLVLTGTLLYLIGTLGL